MLGSDLRDALEWDGSFTRVVAGDLPEADLTDRGRLNGFFDGLRPAVIFNCAAYTDVDACESNRDQAFAVNAEGAGNVAEVAAARGALLIHVSTDFVFDGRKASRYVEEDGPLPLSVYGESKLEGERLVAARAEDWIIARTAWLYGRAGRNLVDRVLARARQGADLAGVTDQVGSPTWTRDLAGGLLALAMGRARGLFHVVNAGACSRYEQIKFIVECAGLSTRVTPATSSAFPRAATVPAHAVLSTDRLAQEAGHAMRPWREALREYVCGEFGGDLDSAP